MHQRHQVRIILLLIFITCRQGLPAADPVPTSSERYEFRENHDRDGIGKFYFGREIAKVMGHEGADWLERPERESEEAPGVLIQQLRINRGETVADIGAGTGYLTRRLAKEVGATGNVLAVDIQPAMLERLTNSLARAGVTNVIPVLGSITNPALPPNSVDLVLMVDVYHEFEFPFEMLQNICRALKPNGRLAFVEYRAEDAQVPIKPLHKMTESQVKREMSSHPLRWTQTISVLPWQHIIVFTKALPGPS